MALVSGNSRLSESMLTPKEILRKVKLDCQRILIAIDIIGNQVTLGDKRARGYERWSGFYCGKKCS